ncbi:hypothetical protein AQUCO_00400380v1 [Aquilegia coerulea]|uniref:Lethal giant larvae (Lgl)-like C-terminal domain-containing protein n=1 Tax=Aquilegia coerulea TaxID=218851 RepID=A0A2G5EUX0_AQUCA|nr:hypothetical protein AQUCO_00400380v1 [Aquilegia coerulea]
MFAKRLFEKVTNLSPPSLSSSSSQHAKFGSVAPTDLDLRVPLHYGIPSTASVLAFDPIQRLMAVGTLDGRIKVIGGDNIEGLLISPKQLPYKYLEFLHNTSFLVGVSNENNIQVWDLEHRRIACSFPWDSNITAFSPIHGTNFMYVGDEWGLMSVLKYDAEEGKLLQLPYHIPSYSLCESAGVSISSHQSIVGLLPQPRAFESRVLIAYEKGLIILWDISEAQAVLVRSYKDLQLRNAIVVGPSKGLRSEIAVTLDHEQEDKEISSLCWASSDGSILAVGYVDGDIMLWNMSLTSSSKGQQTGISSNNVVKLQLSSGEKRLPVIVLRWSACSRSENESGGQLFIYGGNEIGSEEVLTVLSLEWSSGIDKLQCVSRVDLTFDGSFSDLILVKNSGPMKNPGDTLFVLTNPGQIHVYDDPILAGLWSQHEEKASISAIRFPVVVPTVDPYITVTKLCLIPIGGSLSNLLLEMASVMKIGATVTLTTGSKWPLTGGVLGQSFSDDYVVERLYMAGYQDGSVRIWDATSPTLSLICAIESEVETIEVAGTSASVSAVDFFPLTASLAVGNECGLVRVYKLSQSPGETDIHFMTETKHEVHQKHQGKGLQCRAIFSLLSSPVQILQYANNGAKLAVGFGCGRVGMLDMNSLSVLFLTDSISSSSSPVISLTEKASLDIYNIISPNEESMNPKDPADVLFILTRDLNLLIVDSVTGNLIGSRQMKQTEDSTAVAMYIIESSILVSETVRGKHPEQLSQNSLTQDEPVQANNLSGDTPHEVDPNTCSENITSGESSLDSLILVCCNNALGLFSLKSVLKGDYNSICKVNLARPCCWTTTFKSKDEKVCGLAIFYHTGVVEIRSLPDLEVVRESSIMSILRWSFKANMDRTICSSDTGQISLVNGGELAFISLLSCEIDFRIPKSLPSLHDKVLQAGSDAANNLSANQKKKEAPTSGIIDGIINGIKGGKVGGVVDLVQQLDIIFSKAPFQEALELNIGSLHLFSSLSRLLASYLIICYIFLQMTLKLTSLYLSHQLHQIKAVKIGKIRRQREKNYLKV